MVFITIVGVFALLGLMIMVACKAASYHYNLDRKNNDELQLQLIYFATAVILWFALILQAIASWNYKCN